MKIAVVRNAARDGVIAQFRKPCPEKYGKGTVRQVVDALVAGGHTVALFEGDKTLLAELERFLPADPATGQPTGLVLNMAYGIQGEARYTHVPAMLEMAGVPYSGATPLGHAVSLDKVVAKTLMQGAGIPTPAFAVMDHAGTPCAGLRFPLVVKPRHESTSFGLALVQDRSELDAAVERTVRDYGQSALVEEYIEGREVCIGLLGNDPPETLPAVELSFAGRELRLNTFDDKYHRRSDEPEKLCPAPLPPTILRELDDIARATFEACHARDYSRVDIRIDESGRPYVLELNSMASLGAGGSFVRAAEAAGYSFANLINRIVDVTHERYFGRAPCRRTSADRRAARGA
jgi:D-alanine-D-alanine ligase